jgi:hypothetical protein
MDGFTQAQLEQITTAVRAAVREEFADAGLRVDDAEDQDAAREDFRFVRRLRTNFDGAAQQIGRAILGAAITIVLAIIAAGWWTWIGRGGT